MPTQPTIIKASTQAHLDIYAIRDHLIILKDGSVAIVMQASAINFGLLSEEEQDATIYAYGALINSLSFPMQILIRSSKKDITSYVDLLDQQVQKTRSQKIKEQLVKYRQFVKNLVKNNKVLEKKFYIVIPFSTVEVGTTASQLNPFAKAPQKPSYDLNYIIEKAKLQLYPRRDHLIRQFARLGLQIKQLSTKDLVNLFYLIYNPSEYDTAPLQGEPEDFQAEATQSTTKPAPQTNQPATPETPPQAPQVEVNPPGAIAHEQAQQPTQTPEPTPQPNPQATTQPAAPTPQPPTTPQTQPAPQSAPTPALQVPTSSMPPLSSNQTPPQPTTTQ